MKAIYYTSPDGLKAPFGARFWDTLLEVQCSVAIVSASDYRCLPLPGIGLFADSACTTEVVMAYGFGPANNTAARIGTTNSGTTTYRNLTLGDSAVETTFYMKSGANCVAYDAVGMVANGYEPPRYVIGVRPNSDFQVISFLRDE